MKKKLIISICVIAVALFLMFKFPIYFFGFWLSIPTVIVAALKIDGIIKIITVIVYYLLLLIVYFLLRKNTKAKLAYLSVVILMQAAGSYFMEKDFSNDFGKIMSGEDAVSELKKK